MFSSEDDEDLFELHSEDEDDDVLVDMLGEVLVSLEHDDMDALALSIETLLLLLPLVISICSTFVCGGVVLFLASGVEPV